jgi:hypothetical protein
MLNSPNSADPILTANIYASGLVDNLLQQGIVPFWRDVQGARPDGGCWFWIMRYARGGEHLKIRVHGERAGADSLRPLLYGHLERWMEKARTYPAANLRVNNPKAPPIDAEDKAEANFADRTFVATTYGRSYVSLPASPWLEDKNFVALACRCLAATTGVFLAAVDEHGELSDGSKQSLLAKSLISALGASGLGDRTSATEYLAFHRDWLLRFFIPESSKELEIRAHFDAQASSSTARTRLAQLSDEKWARNNSGQEAEPWLRTFAALSAYTQSFAGSGAHQIDPFTTNVNFPPLFKMLHGMANQFGVTPLHEAYVHHLLIKAVENHSLVPA